MPAFKTALRLVFRSPLYLLLYIVFFGFLGVIIVMASAPNLPSSTDQLDRDSLKPNVAIINRDNSVVSQGIANYLYSHSTPIELEDTTKALQDATAQNLSSYIVIIPEGFGDDFIRAARKETPSPMLEVVVNYAEGSAVYMQLLTNQYLASLKIAAIGSPEASDLELISTTDSVTEQNARVEAADIEVDTGASSLTILYFQWMAYPITTGLIVLTGIIFATFQNGELRRRNLCAPLSPGKTNTQIALGCLSLVLMTWLFLTVLSLLPFSGGLDILLTNPLLYGLLALAALVYALVPFTIGFLLSQFGLKEIALNGVANIVSLTFCFVSGVFMGSASMLGEGVQAVAHFTPTYWYSEALLSLSAGGLTPQLLSSFMGKLGIILLFALAIFTVALLIGRMRAQSSEAGGNPAAEAVL